MTVYNLLMTFGFFVVVGIIVKGFRSSTRVKSIDQPDNWQSIWRMGRGGQWR